MTPENQTRISQLRKKALDKTITMEEMREAIVILRQDRVTAAQTSAKSRKAKAPVDAEDLLSQLDGL